MSEHQMISKDDPIYQARLEAQHSLLLSASALPMGVGSGMFVALPFVAGTEGFELAMIPAGFTSVFVCLGIGLLLLASMQGVAKLMMGFWNLRHSMNEISDSQRITCYIANFGLFFLGLGLGFGLAFVT